jgi:SNF family Na+-dependent transporter
MLHPIFSTVLGHPELVADHLANYAALLKEETAAAGRGIFQRVIASVLAIVSSLLALGLIGIAVMLGVLHGSFNWVLVIVPAIAVFVAAVSAYVATRPAALHPFNDFRSQVEADVSALHTAGERHGR